MTDQLEILIVDDTSGVVELISRVLKDMFPSACLWTAVNGQEGLLLALQHQPNLIITDLEMSIMDGFEMIRILRHEQNTNRIPIIGMTNNDYSAAKINSFRMFCNEFLFKPFSLNEFRAKVLEVLDFKDTPASLRPSSDYVKDMLRDRTPN